MPIPRVRFTVRRMMIGMAGLAIVMACLHLRQIAAGRVYRALCIRASAEIIEQDTRRLTLTATPGYIEARSRLAVQLREQADRFDRAARYPWLPTPSEPE